MTDGTQTTLFELPKRRIEPAAPRPEHVELVAKLPASLGLGTMSWAFPGWRGLVFAAGSSPERLAAEGLAAYAAHPLLRAVEIDRSFYEPLSNEQLRAMAAEVPDDFQFMVKAHQECTLARFPAHARYGKKSGSVNPRFLDAAYASEVVVGPTREGLAGKLRALLFQFSPEDHGPPGSFAERLAAFLAALPRGVTYAVELRNSALFTPAYGAALAATGAVHCHNAWSDMPSVLAQAKAIPPRARHPLIVRWLMRPGDSYARAGERLAPFDRIVEEDAPRRDAIARLVVRALQHEVPVLVFVNNDAEGCAPESIARLAVAVAEGLSRAEQP